jgi:histone-lysine N-methyltransferase SETMAR
MVLAFFDFKGLIHTKYMLRGTMVNVKYIVDALGRFLKVFKQKRPDMVAGAWWFHWDNAPVYTAAMVTDWMAATEFKVFERLPYSPDLAPADFFLFPKVKRELAGLILTKETFKKEWEGAARTLKAADFAKAFRGWYECCEKCINMAGIYFEKS